MFDWTKVSTSRGLVFFALALATNIGAQTGATGQDWLIVPGVRVGPVTLSSTHTLLEKSLGKARVIQTDVDIGDGMTQPGTVIDKEDSSRTLAILGTEGPAVRPATVMICYGSTGGPCRWHTADGIGVGTTLKELEQRNARLFVLAGFEWDYAGTVLSWEGGKLQRQLNAAGRLILRLNPPTDKDGNRSKAVTEADYNSVLGDADFPSNHPVMQKLNPVVTNMKLAFPSPGQKK